MFLNIFRIFFCCIKIIFKIYSKFSHRFLEVSLTFPQNIPLTYLKLLQSFATYFSNLAQPFLKFSKKILKIFSQRAQTFTKICSK